MIKWQLAAIVNDLFKLSKTIKHVQESVQANQVSSNQINIKLVTFEQTLSDLNNEVARIKHYSRRVPTGQVVSVRLSDKREHNFREYKSSEGLARPHRTSRDLIFGDRWIDLAEPED
ncbi:hypothetical protein ACFLWX_00315 [Chloroflexota bacterium]